ncbi:uncharacterized protein LOC106710516 [Papilio machaon]|uniref:uncharacterized protein LOC106710516 n=1 Tax=Papilio machaon TaxID=76193 RepID=UPI001E663B2D|nr:uncharacterized protein LOC106710516 [Papilio machaon]
MKTGRSVFVFFIYFKSVNEIFGDCNLSLKTDFGHPSPVYVKSGKFLAPNATTGDILVRRSETLLVGCPGKNRFIVLSNHTTDLDVVEVQCLSGKTFHAGRWVGDFKQIRCNAPPWFTVEAKNISCSDGHKTYRVGYRMADNFYTLYEACFDEGLLMTVYVRHELTPEAKYHQLGGNRPSFIDTGVFGKIRMSNAYALKNQRARVNDTLGDKMDQKYITKKQFLTRGHLAPRADFSLRTHQRASFHYINAAPQWMRGNAGDWAALEDALRRRIASRGKKVTVYTGTHGVCTLADAYGVQHELYLHADDNNNGVIPVPLYYYKVVYDSEEKTAVAFVTINSTYYNTTMIDELTFCSDICDGNRNYSWLRWRSNDGTHSFCCDYDEFIKEIDHLPEFNVSGRFF